MADGSDEIHRAELKKLVATAIGGGMAVVGHTPPTKAIMDKAGPVRLPPRKDPPNILLDQEWCMVTQGRYVSMMEFREKLRTGPLAFAWMGTQAGPGLFQPGIGVTPAEITMTPAGDLRAASLECVFDRSPLRFDPSLDRWSCKDCGSEFSGRDGKVEKTPAEKPLVTFSLIELEGGKRLALVPPNSKPPR